MCWTSGASISDSIKMLADAVRKRMKTEEIVQNRYVDGCPHYTRMVEAATEAFARIELNEAWYRRLTENRRVIAAQLDAMAELKNVLIKKEGCVLQEFMYIQKRLVYRWKMPIFMRTQGSRYV